MKILRPLAIGLTLSLVCTVPALAQDSRPGGNTVVGDTGIWFVPTGETLPKGKWSGGVQLVNFDRSEGFSDITDIGGMFAFGATDRIEIFGAFGGTAHRRRPGAGRAQRPAAGLPDQQGLEHRHRRLRGSARSSTSPRRRRTNGYATALRVMAKIPAASTDDGLGTGKPDFQFDLIGSREFAQKVELSAAAGIKLRGKPDGYNLTPGFVWGIGGAFPSRSRFRVDRRDEGRGAVRSVADVHRQQSRAGHAARMGSGRDARSVRRIPVQREQRLLFRRRRHLHRVVLPASPRFHDVGRQRLRSPRPAGAPRLSPERRQDVRAAGGDGHADRAADTGDAAEPRPDGEGALRAVHG